MVKYLRQQRFFQRIVAMPVVAGTMFAGLLLVILCAVLLDSRAEAKPPAAIKVDENGTVTVPEHQVPLSYYISEAARRKFIERNKALSKVVMDQGIAKYRETMDRFFYAPRLAKARVLYPVTVEKKKIADIRIDVVLPKEGVAPNNQHRALINLHGGGFRIGAGLGGLVESIPLAGLAKIKVISIDYRQGPENEFPAASEDVASVYKMLLKDYKPESIGFYGCSAGGVLTAMTAAWLQKEKLPRPGAIGIFCAGADDLFAGDSRFFAAPLSGQLPPSPSPNPPPTGMSYVAEQNLYDPLVSPVFSPEVLKAFPATLIISGTRDAGLSSAVYTHSRLTRVGVEADLHIWDGMWHGFLYEADLPEAQEAFNVIVEFFDHHLQP